MRRRYGVVLLLFMAGVAAPAAGGGPGTTAADFLVIYADARPAALGGAYTALADDAAGMEHNPAGLVRARHYEISAGYTAWFEDAAFQHIAYTHPLDGDMSACGVSLLYFDAGEFVRTNELGLSTGQRLTARDIAASFGYGRRAGRYLAWGLSGRYIHRELEDRSAGTGAADLGVLYWTPYEPLLLGASVQNIGGSLRFIRDDEPLPLTFRAGLSYRTWLDDLLILADVVKVVDEEAHLAVGAEATLVGAIALRAGWRSDDSLIKGYTVGVGFTVGGVTVDYAFVPYEILGGTHRFTGSVKFGGPTTPDVRRVPDRPFPDAPAARAARPLPPIVEEEDAGYRISGAEEVEEEAVPARPEPLRPLPR